MLTNQTPLFRIAYFPDPILQKRSPIITDFNAIPLASEVMMNTMIANRVPSLSACSCKLNLRMFAMKVDEIRRIFINPTLLDCEGSVDAEESCISFPGVVVRKMRYRDVAISAMDQFGTEFVQILSGRSALVAQHELDHMDGRTLADSMSFLKRQLLARKIKKETKG